MWQKKGARGRQDVSVIVNSSTGEVVSSRNTGPFKVTKAHSSCDGYTVIEYFNELGAQQLVKLAELRPEITPLQLYYAFVDTLRQEQYTTSFYHEHEGWAKFSSLDEMRSSIKRARRISLPTNPQSILSESPLIPLDPAYHHLTVTLIEQDYHWVTVSC